jgi:cell division protease FtsH
MTITPDQITQIHEPPKEVAKAPRRKMQFFDRVKILILLAVWFGFAAALKHSSVPIMSWAEAFREQLQAKWWLLALAGLEALRQIHYLISERNGNYHYAVQHKFFGAWDRWWGKRNPWLRYRMQRLAKIGFWVFLLTVIFSNVWGLSLIDTLVQAPRNLLYKPFGASGLPWFFTIVFGMFQGILYFVGIFWFMSKGGVDTYMPDEIKTRFSDVWGQDKVLEKVREVISFLDKPDEIEELGGYVPGGILLWGPPGTGKTLIAEAIAGETSKPFVFVEPGAFRAMFVGVGVMKVRALYKKLRKLSLRYGGVIVFIDEADTLGNRAGGSEGGFNRAGFNKAGLDHGHSPSCNGEHYVSDATQRRLLAALTENAAEAPADSPSGIRAVVMGGMGGMDGSLQSLLTAMSGLKKPKGGIWKLVRSFFTLPAKQPPKYRILHILATNLPSALDPALLRPGRIDRMYNVSYPLLDGRVRTFNGYLDKIRHDITQEQVGRLATMSRKVSGAQVKDIVNEALIVAMKEGRTHVTWPDLMSARFDKVYGVSDGTASTTIERYETSLHEACHAVAMYRLKTRDIIDIATVEKRGRIGGFVAPVPVEERDFEWKHEIERDVMTYLASLAGEKLFFNGDNSVGVGGDLRSSTSMVMGMLGMSGMGETISSISVSMGGGDRRNRFDERVEKKLRELFDRTMDLLVEERELVLAIAHALLVRSTISGEDIKAIDEGTLGVVLDGAWYKNEANKEKLWHFHQRAMEIHDLAEPFHELTPPDLPLLTGSSEWSAGERGELPPPAPTLPPPPPPAS